MVRYYKKQFTKMPTVALRVPNELLMAVDKRAVNGLTRTLIIREAIKYYVENAPWIAQNVMALQKL